MPTQNALPPDAVTRFLSDLGGLCPPGARLGLAVSGGPDSLALLLLAHAAIPDRMAVATVNHGLRPEAADEARMVAGLCGKLGLPHAILGPEALEPGNTQEAARKLRYRLLGQWAVKEGISHVATAHHRDDVAESFLMRAVRGSGIRGLARMARDTPLPYARDPVRLIRPLLDWSHAELAAIAPSAILDPSNNDARFDRVKIRHLLAREPLLDAAQLARASNHLADADAALEWLCDKAWRSRATIGAERIELDAADLPDDTRRRLAMRAIAHFSPFWNGEGIDGLIATLDDSGHATLAGVKAQRLMDGSWQFGLAPSRARTSAQFR